MNLAFWSLAIGSAEAGMFLNSRKLEICVGLFDQGQGRRKAHASHQQHPGRQKHRSAAHKIQPKDEGQLHFY